MDLLHYMPRAQVFRTLEVKKDKVFLHVSTSGVDPLISDLGIIWEWSSSHPSQFSPKNTLESAG
jgi:hypothetical protein